jgi:phosphoribosylformimino-5-aminoimidazole carboxamide ribotide isomerase
MIVIPAIDIRNGNCVRLSQGRKEAETIFSDDPAAMAERWEKEGAELLHVVDLDGAFEKAPRNLEAIRNIRGTVKIGIQVGGGIRNMETLDKLFSLGITRVVIGTEAIRNPLFVTEACSAYPGRIVVGIDARDGRVAIEGWTETTTVGAADLAKRFEDSGVSAINFTDISRDGMQTGPNLEETRKLAEAIQIPVVASGGVATLKDILDLIGLEDYGVSGIITGKALYSGSLKLSDAIAATREKRRGT